MNEEEKNEAEAEAVDEELLSLVVTKRADGGRLIELELAPSMCDVLGGVANAVAAAKMGGTVSPAPSGAPSPAGCGCGDPACVGGVKVAFVR